MNGWRGMETPCPKGSQGAALLVMLLVMVLAFGSVLLTSLAGNNPETERRRRTLETLAQAKQALIAWAVLQGDTGTDSHHRPGTLPCPDRNFFGEAASGNASGSCSSGGETSIGRLPWKSLGMEKLRDAHGEPLWYAVSDSFRNPNLNSQAINSDSKGTLLLYAADGTLLTPAGEELAAVIFAPGPPLPGQDRKIPPDNTASDYLDAFAGKNNARAAGPFVQGPVKDGSGHLAVNDFVIGVSVRELVAALEKRALNQAQKALKEYFADNGNYPHPAPSDAADCASRIGNVKASPIPPCASDSATCSGRLPEDALAPYLDPDASWFLQNGWGRVLIYAIDDSGAGCATFLKVGVQPKSYVLIASGNALGGRIRPSTSLADYLEDPGNADGWSGNLDFVVPGTGSNDQMRSEP